MSPSPQPDSPPAPAPRRRARWWWLVLPVLVVIAVLALLGRGPGSAEGVVLVELGERIPHVSPSGGQLLSIDVGLGQKVSRGQVLARLKTDAGPVALTAQRDGTVGSVPVQPDQFVTAGTVVVWLVDRDVLPSLVALFPGRFREQLQPGRPLQYRLPGIPFAIETTIETVASPEESLRFARTRKWPGLSLEDGAVLVRAHVPSRNFVVEGRSRIYQDGTMGKATVPAR